MRAFHLESGLFGEINIVRVDMMSVSRQTVKRLKFIVDIHDFAE